MPHVFVSALLNYSVVYPFKLSDEEDGPLARHSDGPSSRMLLEGILDPCRVELGIGPGIVVLWYYNAVVVAGVFRPIGHLEPNIKVFTMLRVPVAAQARGLPPCPPPGAAALNGSS